MHKSELATFSYVHHFVKIVKMHNLFFFTPQLHCPHFRSLYKSAKYTDLVNQNVCILSCYFLSFANSTKVVPAFPVCMFSSKHPLPKQQK